MTKIQATNKVLNAMGGMSADEQADLIQQIRDLFEASRNVPACAILRILNTMFSSQVVDVLKAAESLVQAPRDNS